MARKISIYETDLYQILRDGLPERFTDSRGKLNTVQLANECGLARYTIYRWFTGERVSPPSAQKIIDISNRAECDRKGKISKEVLTPFILGF